MQTFITKQYKTQNKIVRVTIKYNPQIKSIKLVQFI